MNAGWLRESAAIVLRDRLSRGERFADGVCDLAIRVALSQVARGRAALVVAMWCAFAAHQIGPKRVWDGSIA